MNVSIHASTRTIERFKQVQTLLEQLHPEAAPQALLVPGSPVPRGSTIVFPGSFNPPTNAHLALLKQARRAEWAVRAETSSPTPLIPTPAPTAPGQGPDLSGPYTVHLYAAISKHTIDKETVERPVLLDRVMLLDMVLHRHLRNTGILLFNRGLYVEEAEAVRTSFPEVTRLFFLIGFDKIVQILDPRYYQDRDTALRELFALAELLVAPRGDAGAETLHALLSQPENQPFAGHIHALPFSPTYRTISSTAIRQNPHAHFDEVPPEVQRFIQETHAYDPPQHLQDGTQIDYYGERVKALEALLKNTHFLTNGNAGT
jgi:nicotinic acid mononucleotide adenylyltransferase